MSAYKVSTLEEIEPIDDGRCPFRPVRFHFGIESFGANAWTAAAEGDRLINEHDESDDRHEELYVVLRGKATFELDGERVEASAGSFVFCEPGVKRTAFADEAGTTLLALGGAPGKAYESQGWEVWAPLNRFYQAGEYAEAADRAKPILAGNPGHAGPLYNVACCESLAGRTVDAIAHLREAFAISESSVRGWAEGDSDLDPLRGEPAFQELFGTA
ncbi:MAG TPA: cupin domain-containing protein [Gaiellaceae bacterium]|nr:cupin domain-containing protein [Gaiellaceae bacterium]